MIPLLKLNEPTQFASGLWPDPAPNQPKLWTDGLNVEFSDGKVRKVLGWESHSNAAAPITGMTQAYVGGERRVYYGAGSKVVLSLLGIDQEIGTGFAADSRWDLEPYGAFLFAANGLAKPRVWKNTGMMVELNTPLTAPRLVSKLEIFPIFFQGQEACWPAYNDFEDFVPGPGKRAGQYFIRDLDGDIMAVAPLGNSLVYYSQDMFGFVTFIGGESTFGFKTSQGGGIGAVSRQAVVAAGPYHMGMSRKGIWQSDGVSYNYVAKPAISQWIESVIDWTRASEVVAVNLESQNRVEFYFPCLDDVIRGVGYAYAGTAKGAWTKLVFPVTAAGEEASGNPGPAIAFGTEWGFMGESDNAGGEAMSSGIRSAPLDMGSRDKLKRWQMVQVYAKFSGLFQMRVGYSNTDKAAPDWTDWFTVQEENYLQDRESNFITVEFRGSAFGQSWEITGMEIFGVAVGRKR